MATRTTSLYQGWLNLFLMNAALANVGDAGGLLPSAAAGVFHVNLHTAYPTKAGSFANLISYTGYLVPTIARSTAGWTLSGDTADNDALLDFGAMTAGTGGTGRWISLSSAAGGGTMHGFAPLCVNGSHKVFTARSADEILVVPGHALAVGNEIVALPTLGGALPTGLTEGTNYFVTVVSGDEITLSATSGGSTLPLTSSGAGVLFRHTPIPVTAAPSIQPRIPIGALDYIAA